jgi:hypothetical protein
MTPGYHAMRVLKKRDTGVIYLAAPDVLKYYEQEKLRCRNCEEEAIWIKLIEKFTSIIYEGIDHDI